MRLRKASSSLPKFRLRIKPEFSPTFRCSLVENALVTAEWFLNPKFNPLRHDSKSRPERRTRDFFDSESQRGHVCFNFAA
jgi:hypothetical protein